LPDKQQSHVKVSFFWDMMQHQRVIRFSCPHLQRVDLEKEGIMLLQNTGVQLSSNAATYPRIMSSSATLLQKPQNSQ
jgi:hypothetical protein